MECEARKRNCGGCPLLEMPYPEQLTHKHAEVKRLLGRFGAVQPVLGMQQPLHCRCKAIATFARQDGKLVCGTYAEGTHRVVPYTDCLLQAEVLNRALQSILEAARSCRLVPFDEDRGTGFLRHVLLRCTAARDAVMAVLVTADAPFAGSRDFVRLARRGCPELVTVVQNINDRRTSAVLGRHERVLYGSGHLLDTLCGHTFALSARSFYQVNPAQTEVLYRTAVDAAELTGREKVVDAYCGVGTIGILAAASAGDVLGVERNAEAVHDAVANARRSGVGNIHFLCADASRWLEEAAAARVHADVVFMDPPREGSTPQFLGALLALRPRRIVYISCNPASLARDLDLLRRGYRAALLQPVDLFPYTAHIETVALLDRI